jgi:hypothetical protein
MTVLTMNRKIEKLAPDYRPWLLGVPGFLIAFSFLVWIVTHVASWVFVVLKENK